MSDPPAAPTPAPPASPRTLVVKLAPFLVVLGVGLYLLFAGPPSEPEVRRSPASASPPDVRASEVSADPLRALPRSAVVLVHGATTPFTLDQRLLFDVGASPVIDYIALADRGQVDAHLRTLGVTHVLWPREAGTEHPVAAELVFREYTLALTERWDFDGHHLAALPPSAVPPGPKTQLTLTAGCNTAVYANWLHEIAPQVADLERRDCNTVTLTRAALVDTAYNHRFVVLDGRMPGIHQALVDAGMRFLFSRGSLLAFVNLAPRITAESVRALEH